MADYLAETAAVSMVENSSMFEYRLVDVKGVLLSLSKEGSFCHRLLSVDLQKCTQILPEASSFEISFPPEPLILDTLRL